MLERSSSDLYLQNTDLNDLTITFFKNNNCHCELIHITSTHTLTHTLSPLIFSTLNFSLLEQHSDGLWMHTHFQSSNPGISIETVDDDGPDPTISLTRRSIDNLISTKSYSMGSDRGESVSPVLDSSGASGGGSPIPPPFVRYFHAVSRTTKTVTISNYSETSL